MEIFEIHITGDKSILKNGNDLGIKTISIDLLQPDRNFHRTEYMTSHVHKCENFEICRKYVDDTVDKLRKAKTNIIRVKIECPYYEHYVNDSIYIESHFEDRNGRFPISKNQNKDFYLATDREYNRELYKNFTERYNGEIVELCLFDSFVEEDLDWFSLYGE